MDLKSIDLKRVEQIMELMRKQGFNHFKISSKDQAMELTMQAPGSGGSIMTAPQAVTVPVSNAPQAPKNQTPPNMAKGFTAGNVVKSPFVGTFYRSSSPESAPFVDIGSRVRKGQTLCIVEAMKLMNEIESDQDGVLREILVENGQPVEFDQALFVIE